MKWGIEATDAVEVIEADKFLMPGKSLSMHTVCCFWFFEAKEAVEVIEASDVIMSFEVIEATKVFRTTQILKIKNLMAKPPYFDVLRKK